MNPNRVIITILIFLRINLNAQTTLTGFVTDSLRKPLPVDSVYLSKTTKEINVSTPIEDYILQQQSSVCPDQIFVHLDRNKYKARDTIYFQAYIRDRFTNDFESKSVSLYALLFDYNNLIVDSSRFKIKNSTSSGWMVIPSNSKSGKYHFTAFTSIMQNFDPSEAFQTDLFVKGTDKTPGGNVASTDSEYFDLKFLPEGGNSVQGLEQRIGFNATAFWPKFIYNDSILISSINMKNRTIIAILLIAFSSNSFSQKTIEKKIKIDYKPENYELNQIDTTVNDSIRLIVRHFTLMDSYARDYGDVTPDSIVIGYRDYAMEIGLVINGTETTNKKILKSDFITDQKYWKNLTLFKASIESFDPKNNQIILKVGLGLPDLYTPIFGHLIISYTGEIITKLN